MSMPVIERPDNPVDRDQSINDLIESVALVETGLSHIINAEGEKLQKVIKYDDPTADVPIEDIINANNSAEKMINTVSKLEMILQNKLDIAKELDTETTLTEYGAIINYNGQVEMVSDETGPVSGTVTAFSGIDRTNIVTFYGDLSEIQPIFSYTTFPMPRNGVLTSMSACFESITSGITDMQVYATLYKANPLDETYYRVEGATVALSPIIPAGAQNAMASGSTVNINATLEANSKLALAFHAESPAGFNTLIGTGSASLNIR